MASHSIDTWQSNQHIAFAVRLAPKLLTPQTFKPSYIQSLIQPLRSPAVAESTVLFRLRSPSSRCTQLPTTLALFLPHRLDILLDILRGDTQI
jgi:hypothetical protein